MQGGIPTVTEPDALPSETIKRHRGFDITGVGKIQVAHAIARESAGLNIARWLLVPLEIRWLHGSPEFRWLHGSLEFRWLHGSLKTWRLWAGLILPAGHLPGVAKSLLLPRRAEKFSHFSLQGSPSFGGERDVHPVDGILGENHRIIRFRIFPVGFLPRGGGARRGWGGALLPCRGCSGACTARQEEGENDKADKSIESVREFHPGDIPFGSRVFELWRHPTGFRDDSGLFSV